MLHQFGNKLRYLRLQYGVTQVELAQELAVARQSHVSLLERGQRAPSLELVIRVADRFCVAIDYLLRDTIPEEHIITVDQPAQQQLPDLFGRKLKYLRIQRGITQAELAGLLSLRTQSHISLLETGRSEPSIELVLMLTDIFGVTTDYLLRDAIPIDDASPDTGSPD